MGEVDAYIKTMESDGNTVSPEYREMYVSIQKRHTAQVHTYQF